MPTALITGPTAGLGLEFARALAGRRYDLVLVSRDAGRLGQVADELTGRFGVDAEVLPADLADRAQLHMVEQRLQRPKAPVDLLVNNAGFGLREPFPTGPIEDEQRMLDVLVGAVLRLSHAALPPMLERGAGSIVNVSSVAGFFPSGTYAAAKAWVTSFSLALDDSYRDRGCRVMALCPGFVHTEFHSRMDRRTDSIPEWMWLNAADVVAEALAAMDAGSALCIPSRRYRAIVTMARLAPRRVSAAVATRRPRP
jgi:hypothetical protein